MSRIPRTRTRKFIMQTKQHIAGHAFQKPLLFPFDSMCKGCSPYPRYVICPFPSSSASPLAHLLCSIQFIQSVSFILMRLQLGFCRRLRDASVDRKRSNYHNWVLLLSSPLHLSPPPPLLFIATLSSPQ